MEINVLHEEGKVPVAIFEISGPVNSSEPLEQAAAVEYDLGYRYFLLDLTNSPYMSSAGLRALHTIFSLLREIGVEDVKAGLRSGTYQSKHLKLMGPSKLTTEALKATGFDMFLEIHTDRKKALASFG